MDDIVKAAFGKSFEKWILLSSGEADRIPGCELCFAVEDCVDCPVMEVSGEPGCNGTPYVHWRDRAKELGINSPEAIEAAQKELEFLQKIYRDETGEDYKPKQFADKKTD